MATVCAAESTDCGRVHNLGATGDSGDRHAAAERFRHRDEVGLDAEVFGREPFAGARESGLNLVGDEEDAVLAADGVERLEIVARRNDEAAFA